MSTFAEVDAELTAPGQFFAIETVDVRGTPTRVWAATPPTLADALEQGRVAGGDRPFLILGDERVTHHQHYERVVVLADRLVRELGVVKGDRVAIAMRNYPEWSVAFFATVLVGAIAVPLNAYGNGNELAFGVTDSGARVLIADGERLERLAPHVSELSDTAVVGTRLDDRRGGADLPGDVIALADLVAGPTPTEVPRVSVDPDDDATIFYTSGTTGLAKGVRGTHRNMCTNLISIMYLSARAARQAGAPVPPNLGAPGVILAPVPLFHAFGCHGLLVPQAFFGGTLVLMRKWIPKLRST